MKIARWEEWQTYRKDRGTPPWIKVHRNLFSNPEWSMLSDSEKGQLVSMWILAADKGGEIPSDPRIIMKMAQLDSPPNINRFIELQFIVSDDCQDGVKAASSCCQTDQPETYTEAYSEAEAKAEALEKTHLPGKPGDGAQNADLRSKVASVVDYLNGRCGTAYRYGKATTKFIKGRLDDGYTVEDMKRVVDKMAAEWKGTKWERCLRPETLFNQTKFEGYVGQIHIETPEQKNRREIQEWIDGDNGGGLGQPSAGNTIEGEAIYD